MNKYIKLFMNDNDLKVGENFKVSGDSNHCRPKALYYINNNAELWERCGGELEEVCTPEVLCDLLEGNAKIVKLPECLAITSTNEH